VAKEPVRIAAAGFLAHAAFQAAIALRARWVAPSGARPTTGSSLRGCVSPAALR
jgi:hypothetical protein